MRTFLLYSQATQPPLLHSYPDTVLGTLTDLSSPYAALSINFLIPTHPIWSSLAEIFVEGLLFSRFFVKPWRKTMVNKTPKVLILMESKVLSEMIVSIKEKLELE